MSADFPSEARPLYAPFFSVMGASSAMIFSAMGAAYGTAKSGVGIAAMAIMKPERIMKSVIPIIMAGIGAIYGVVVAVLISQKTKGATSIMEDFINLGAGLPSVCLVYQLVWLSVLSVMPVFVELLNSQNFTLE